MSTIDRLLNIADQLNITDSLDDDTIDQIVRDITSNYEIDLQSRAKWLDDNKEAIDLVKVLENMETKEFPFNKASKAIYPLLSLAVIHLSSRLITNLVRQNRVAECAVLGADPDGMKKAKAEQVSSFISYELLVESDTWLLEMHKLCHILSAWGMAFKRVYYDPTEQRIQYELIAPESVVINNNITSLDKCRRITLKHSLSKNDIVERMRSGQFRNIDIDKLDIQFGRAEDSSADDKNPIYDILEQACYLDLDDDGYEEPYIAVFHPLSRTLLQLQPNFEVKDVYPNDKGEVLKIKAKPFIIDYHLIDDPEGKYYSLGLNHLLLHPTKSATHVLRALLDSGIAANTQGGFATKAFSRQLKDRSLTFELNEYKIVDSAPNVDLRSQILPLPFKEPSQVLFQLLGLLIESGKEMGFIVDALVGDTPGQNVPATTMLAIIEQGTRAFKPIIQKLYASLKKEFKLTFHLHSLYLSQERYIRFHDKEFVVVKEDFNEAELDIVPVADPNMASEAHKYARLQAMLQPIQMGIPNINTAAVMTEYFKGIGIENPEQYLVQPQPPQPTMDEQVKMGKLKLDEQKLKIDSEIGEKQIKVAELGMKIKHLEAVIKKQESDDKQREMRANAGKNLAEAKIKERMTRVAEDKVVLEHERLKLLDEQHRDEMRVAETEATKGSD